MTYHCAGGFLWKQISRKMVVIFLRFTLGVKTKTSHKALGSATMYSSLEGRSIRRPLPVAVFLTAHTARHSAWELEEPGTNGEKSVHSPINSQQYTLKYKQNMKNIQVMR